MSPRSIALVALTLAFAAACSQSKSHVGESDTVSVSITIGLSASQVGAATLEFWVNHPTALTQPITGTVPVTDPTTSFTLTQLPVVPPSDPYTLFMAAFRSDGSWVCEGTTTFSIMDGQTQTVANVLTCPTSDPTETGYIGIDATFDLNFCPRIEEITADPMLTEMIAPRK